MDTSEQYILMCKKAKELQAMWKPEAGDFYALDFIRGHFVCTKNEKPFEECAWVPRIDQLIGLYTRKFYHGILHYHTMTEMDAMLEIFESVTGIFHSQSIETYLLNKIYIDVYNKKWNGEDWI